MRFRLAVLTVAAIIMSSPVRAQFTGDFGGPDFIYHATGPGPAPNYIWTTGDYWGQTFITGLSSATDVSLNLTFGGSFGPNTLQPGNPLDMEVLLNGTQVGTFVINPGDTGETFNSGPFAAISGPNMDVMLEATNTIQSGAGSVSLLADQSSSSVTITGGQAGTPEPAAPLALSIGCIMFAVCGIVQRRRSAVR